MVLIWKLRTSPLSWACLWVPPELEEAPRKPGVHPGMALYNQRCPRQQVLASAQRGLLGHNGPAAQAGDCPHCGESVTPPVPPSPSWHQGLAATTSHSPAGPAGLSAAPGDSPARDTVPAAEFPCHSCLTREAIHPRPAPSGSLFHQVPLCWVHQGNRASGKGVATGPKAPSGDFGLAQNKCRAELLVPAGNGLPDSLIPQ